MKIALAQLNYHIGNFKENAAKIIKTIERAALEKADLVLFSELSVCGYPPLDMLENDSFIDACFESAVKIASHCTSTAAIIGAPTRNKNKGKKLYNSALLCYDGEIREIRNKTLLPTYDIFDEYRYFEPNLDFELVSFKNYKIALTICEDLWYDQPVEAPGAKSKLYSISPMRKLAVDAPDFIVNIAASPFSYSKHHRKREVFTNNAKQNNIPLFYVNQTGGQTELIFDGGSKAVNSNGYIVTELESFAEDYRVVDYDTINNNERPQVDNPMHEVIPLIHDALITGIKDYFRKMNLTTAILGLSGGIDSAVSTVLAVKALGAENVRVILLPSKYSSQHSIDDAIALADNLGIKYDIIKIQQVVDEFEKTLAPHFKGLTKDITEENIQARTRGVLLMAFSNKFGNILLNTSNKSEAAVGYSTLYGDMNGGLSVLGDVYKLDVFRLAEYINAKEEVIPDNTITKPPSAELRPDQKDTDSLPAYQTLDEILYNYIELQLSAGAIIEKGLDTSLVNRIIRMVNLNEYKRYQFPPILRISSKAFGAGRRMPLVAKY